MGPLQMVSYVKPASDSFAMVLQERMVSGKLLTYPSPKLTLMLWGGVGVQFPRNLNCSNNRIGRESNGVGRDVLISVNLF